MDNLSDPNTPSLPIVLIGPISAGKTSTASHIASHLSLPRAILDEIRFDYYREIGYDHDYVVEMVNGPAGLAWLFPHWKPFEVHAVERVVVQHANCVIDFGAGHSVFEDSERFARVQTALDPIKNVILLLPSPDHEISIRELRRRGEIRNEGPDDPVIDELNAHFVRHPSNYKLAKQTVYTLDKTPEEVALEVIALLQ